MCGRVAQARSIPELARFYGAEDLADLPEGRYNVAPTQSIAVVVQRDDRRVVAAYRWGLIPYWAEDPRVGARHINARAETVATTPAYRDSFHRRRCLVPVDGFYEWRQSAEGRQPFYVTSVDGEPLALAGLWATWRAPGSDGPPLRSCSIVTTTPNVLMAPIHDRMPVILPARVWERWLDPAMADKSELRAMLRPAEGDRLVAYAVSTLVNTPRNDGRRLIERLEL